MTERRLERLLFWAASVNLSIHPESVVWDVPEGLASIQFHDGTGAGVLRAIDAACGMLPDDEQPEGFLS